MKLIKNVIDMTFNFYHLEIFNFKTFLKIAKKNKNTHIVGKSQI